MYQSSCIKKCANLVMLVMFIVSTFCSDTIDDLKNSYCFFENYVKQINAIGDNFDYITCHSFLNKIQETSSFFPICGEINFHLQIIHQEYGSDNVDPSKTKLTELMTNIREAEDDVLVSANRVYMSEDDMTKIDSFPQNNYIFERYNELNIGTKIREFKVWVRKATKGMIDMNLDAQQFENESRIYISTITFKDDWADAFDVEYTKSDIFKLQNDKTTERKYMNKIDHFRYEKINEGGLNFRLVVIPYKHQTKESVPRRVMVYLIPENCKTKLTDLWNSFYIFSKTKGIKETIIGCGEEYLDLYIPKVEKLYSQFNVTDIFSDVFDKNNSYSCGASMSTYINIDEKGTEASAYMCTICEDGIGAARTMPITVKANVPHLAFIYDLNLERILFILNDNGPVKE